MPTNAPHTPDLPPRAGGHSGTPAGDAGSASLGATEDDVLRGDEATTPAVTDMGLDERGRDEPDVPDFGRGQMPDQPAIGDVSDTGGTPDVPGSARSLPGRAAGGRPGQEAPHQEEPADQGTAAGESAAPADRKDRP